MQKKNIKVIIVYIGKGFLCQLVNNGIKINFNVNLNTFLISVYPEYILEAPVENAMTDLSFIFQEARGQRNQSGGREVDVSN